MVSLYAKVALETSLTVCLLSCAQYSAAYENVLVKLEEDGQLPEGRGAGGCCAGGELRSLLRSPVYDRCTRPDCRRAPSPSVVFRPRPPSPPALPPSFLQATLNPLYQADTRFSLLFLLRPPVLRLLPSSTPPSLALPPMSPSASTRRARKSAGLLTLLALSATTAVSASASSNGHGAGAAGGLEAHKKRMVVMPRQEPAPSAPVASTPAATPTVAPTVRPSFAPFARRLS